MVRRGPPKRTYREIIEEIIRGIRSEKAILLVEGSLDLRFYSRYVDSSSCFVQITDGKKNNIQTNNKIKNYDFFRNHQLTHLSIIDRDYDFFKGISNEKNSIFLTDKRDLECTILSDGLISKILHNFFDGTSKEEVKAVAEKIVAAAKFLGFIRIINEVKQYEEGINNKLNDISQFSKFINFSISEFTINKESAVKYLLGKELSMIYYGQDVVFLEIIESAIAKLISKYDLTKDDFMICNGHDLVKIISIAILILEHKMVGIYDLEECLLSNYYDSFLSTNLYQNLKKFQDNYSINFLHS